MTTTADKITTVTYTLVRGDALTVAEKTEIARWTYINGDEYAVRMTFPNGDTRLMSRQNGATRIFTTRSGARKAVTRDLRGDFSR